jgi:hypothetical protein
MAKNADHEWWSTPGGPDFEGQRMVTGICTAHRKAACKNPLCVSVPDAADEEVTDLDRVARAYEIRTNETKKEKIERLAAALARTNKRKAVLEARQETKQVKQAKPSQAPDTIAHDDKRNIPERMADDAKPSQVSDTTADDDERNAAVEKRKVKFNEARSAKFESNPVKPQKLREQLLQQQTDVCSMTLLRPKAASAAFLSAVSVKKAVVENAAEETRTVGQQAAPRWGLMQADFDGTPWGKKYLVVSKGEQVYLHSMVPGSMTYAMGQVSRQGSWGQGMFPISHWRPLSQSVQTCKLQAKKTQSDEFGGTDRLAALGKESRMQAHQGCYKDETKREMFKPKTLHIPAVGSALSSNQIGQVVPSWAAWRPQRTQVKQEAKDEATTVLGADSDDDQWGSWGPSKAAVKPEMIKEEKPDTAAVGSAPQVIPARKSTAHAWQWCDKNWHYKNTWSVVD